EISSGRIIRCVLPSPNPIERPARGGGRAGRLPECGVCGRAGTLSVAVDSPSVVIAEPSVRRGVVKAYFALTKPRIIELLLITTVPAMVLAEGGWPGWWTVDRKSTRLNSSHVKISYAVFCLKKKKT